jgi:lysophospholipase L1-like esterase
MVYGTRPPKKSPGTLLPPDGTLPKHLEPGALSATYATKEEVADIPTGGDIRLDALAAGKRLRAVTAGNRSVPAVGITVGAITGGALAASGSVIPGAVRVNAYDRTNTRVTPALRILGTRAVQAAANYPRYDLIKPDPSIVTFAPGTLTGTSLAVDTSYGGSAIDVIIRRGGGTAPHIITVDGLVAANITDAALAAAGISGGDFARIPLTFTDARQRIIGYSQATAASEFPGFDIAPAFPLAYPATLPKGPRFMISGDSFTEGTGSNGGFPYAQWVAWHMGWPDVWQAGSGSTGYVADGQRLALIDRYQNDLINQAPDILVIAMGINDLTSYASTPATVTAAAATIWDAVIAQLPATELVIVGPWSPKGGVYTDETLMALDAELHAMAKTRGLRFISPIQEGWITGNGKVGATTGNGNADLYTSNDGTHPSPAGHEYLGWRLAGHLSVPYLEPAT